eukprot:CAMPEP_0176095840 /NCGR_PEP_ID=MMETSP0120_2-20121206/48043_1 /TAXON_ID=160619 /ORGANISM="Kryptoperidinium foliaceum, Strain CCMP 1326" /LENGTH=457 /DNA_ID=CAMNT_0017429819 /DNA_START=80 /DNA_END=1453 /DNA_ORIENTATION=+
MAQEALQSSAKEFLDKVQKGKDAPNLARKFVNLRPPQIPGELVAACAGDIQKRNPPCPESLRVLLEARGNPNDVDPRGPRPIPLFHTACWAGSLEVVRILLDARADPAAKDPRMKTPALNTALAAGNASICLELLNRNADVSWSHEDGATPLHVATAWIASKHNSEMRQPPLGEEPRAVIAMMLHNGVDPLKREGMTVGANRREGHTPLEGFRNEIRNSPWRDHPNIGTKFYTMSQQIHCLLEQAEQAMKHKISGNDAYNRQRYESALESYEKAREVWAAADVRGHHVATLWSNTALTYKRLEQWDKCHDACNEGLTHYCLPGIREKLEYTLQEVEKTKEDLANGVVKEKPPQPEVVRNPPTPLKTGWVEDTRTKPMYGDGGSEQGKVDKPGPFICPFHLATDAGFVDGVDGWKDRKTREEQKTDQELVAAGLMSPDLLDDPKTVQYINPLPPQVPY